MDLNDDENIEWLMESSKTVENVVENDNNLEQMEQDSGDLCRFLQVLRASFESEPVLVESKAKGTVESEEELQKLIKRLQVLGYFYAIRTSEKKDKPNSKLLALSKKFPCSSHPYRVLAYSRYYCTHKSKEPEEKESSEATNSEKLSKCKAILEVRQVEVFTNVFLSLTKRKRQQTLGKLRRSLKSNRKCHAKGEIKYGVVISLPKMHNHSPVVRGRQLNEEVKAAMHYVWRSGTTSIGGIQEKLYHIVDKEFENDSIKPSRDNTAFYPNQKVIYNHLRRDGTAWKPIYKRRIIDPTELKNKTKEILNFLTKKVEECSDSEILLKIFKRIDGIENVFKNNDVTVSEETVKENENES